MIDPLPGRNHGARRLGRLGFGGGPAVAFASITFTAFVHRMALNRADRADAVSHFSAPARRSIWARISSI